VGAPSGGAPSVGVPSGSAPSVRGVLRLLEPFPGRLEFAIRLALLCALTTLCAEIYQTPEPALTTYLAFFVIKPDRATSVVTSIIMGLLITLVIGMALLVTMAVIDLPFWRVVMMTLISFIFLFVASSSKLKPIGGIIALIVAYALDVLGTAHIGEIATRALLYAWLFVATPAAICIVLNLVLGPPPRQLAERALAHRLRLAAQMLRGPDMRTREAFAEYLLEGPGEVPAWLKLAGVEKTSPPQDLAALRQAAASTTAIMLLVDFVTREPGIGLPGALAAIVAQTLDQMAGILHAGFYPVDITLDADEAGLAPLATAALADLREVLAHFAEVPPPEPSRAPASKAGGGFFLPDAFSNPAHVQYALKTTAAAMFCYVVYSLLDWPGIHTCLITCYIVSLGTTAETVEKLTLRILGALAGAAIGIAEIVFLMPDVTSIGGLMGVVFAGAFASGWIAGGSPRIAYAGFQVAFAFFLSVIQGSSPAFDMSIARDRVIGILFGNLTVYLVFSTIWPTTVGARIDPAIAALLRRLSAMATAVGRPARYALAGEVQAALGAIGQDLALARYEPGAIRPPADWLQTRRQAVAEIAALPAPVLLGRALAPGRADGIAMRLDRLADHVGAQPMSPSADGQVEEAAPLMPDASASAAALALDQLIEPRLQGLERALAEGPGEPREGTTDHAPA
jgi:multidrug resistance protein MdtO